MLATLTASLPVFEEYATLFHDAYELQEPLRLLYDDYVTFTVDSYVILRRTKWCKLS